MSFTVLPEGIYLICNMPDFLPIILTFISMSSRFLKISLVDTPVTMESIRILTNASESSSVRYTTLSPASAKFTPRLAKNRDLPAPDPPAKIFNSPLLNPPNSLRSIQGHPVDTCPFLSLSPISRARGSAK